MINQTIELMNKMFNQMKFLCVGGLARVKKKIVITKPKLITIFSDFIKLCPELGKELHNCLHTLRSTNK